MSNWSRVNPHEAVPKDASAHKEARDGSCSLPINDINTIESSNAIANARHETTVFRNVTRFCRAGDVTMFEAVLLIS
jgi:hypothetical protein